MSNQLLFPPVLIALDNNGDTVSGAKLHSYEAGTTTAQSLFTSADSTVAATNPVVADSNGKFPQLYMGSGQSYKLRLSNSADTLTYWEADDYRRVDLEEYVDTLYDLKAYSGPATNLFMRGRSSVGDTGAGRFYWDATSNETVDDGIIVAKTGHSGAGRWKRHFVGPVYANWYLDSLTDDATLAIRSALDAVSAGDKVVLDPNFEYRCKTMLTLTDDDYIDFQGARFGKRYNGTMIKISGNRVKLHDLKINGNHGLYTGDGIELHSGFETEIFGDIQNMTGYALNISQTDMGQRGHFGNGQWESNGGSKVSIRFPEIESIGDRFFEGIYTGGRTLAELRGAENVVFEGCNFKNMVYTNESRKILVTGCQIANGAAPSVTYTVLGNANVLVGNRLSGSVALGEGATDCDVSGNVQAKGNEQTGIFKIEDWSGNEKNRIILSAEITPDWEASTTNPDIGSGLNKIMLSRRDNEVALSGYLSFTTSTTFGDGTWILKLPEETSSTPGFDKLVPKDHSVVGPLMVFNSGVAFRIGVATMASGTNEIKFVVDETTNYFTATKPHTWKAGDRIEWSLSYVIN